MVNNFKRIGIFIPHIAAILFILLLVFISVFLCKLPADGLDWSRVDGLVQFVYPWSPARDLVHPGDKILAVDNVPASQAPSVYSTKSAGDKIKVTLQRDEQILDHEITLSLPPPSKLIERFEPVVVALSFWLIGVLIITFAPNSIRTNLFFSLCMFGSGILASGSVSSFGPEWTSTLFNILLWWIGPLYVHFHLHFPEERSGLFRWRVYTFLYFIAILGSLPFILYGPYRIQANPLNRFIYTAGRFYLAINLLIVVLLLAFSYLYATRSGTRQQIRIITFFGGLSLLIVVAFTLLPSALIYKPLVPYEAGFLFLLLIPLSYGYSIVRYLLINIEKFLNRGAAFVLVFTILIGLYVVLIALVDRFLPNLLNNDVALASIIIILLGMSFETLRKRLQYFVDWVFYGGWYDYRSATANITDGFGQYTDSDKLGEIIIDRLKKTLRLEYAHMLRISSQGSIFPLPSEGKFQQDLFKDNDGLSPIPFSMPRKLIQTLLKNNQVIDAKEFNHILKEELATDKGLGLICKLDGARISPILGNETILGLLVLGPKKGREVFSNEDFDIVILVSRHAGIALQNIHLLNELRHRASEIVQLHREIVRAREEERKRLSLEIHDNIIQALVGLNFDLGRLQSEEVSNLREEVRQIVSDLRQMCSELRPPTLDNLGLVPAVRSLLRELGTTNGHLPKIQFRVEGDENIHIPEYIALNTYRVLSESLRNILRHARANEVQIRLDLHPEKICLEVKDDGCGFSVPQPLGKLLADQHFGLVGMRERVEYFRGDLSIKSSLGEGTRIVASIPLTDPLGSLALERILDE